MKTKIKKTALIISLIICISAVLSIMIQAYQADAVHVYNKFDGTINCHGYLYIFTRSQNSLYDTASAETSISKRTPEIEDVYVKYWYVDYNSLDNKPDDWKEGHATSDSTVTPTFNEKITSLNAKRLCANHQVVYTELSKPYNQFIWNGATKEVDDLTGD